VETQQRQARTEVRSEVRETVMQYCSSAFSYQRRKTREVIVGDPARGGVVIGGEHPVVVQSMLTCDTMDTAESVKQTLELVEVGCQIVRITAPTVKDAANLKNIVAELSGADRC
jgi:(E)-4-hydroxy-3-methylbut-2-enyl-diphosphate synthase